MTRLKVPTVAGLLRSARSRLGISQADLSTKLDELGQRSSQSLIAQFEKGRITNPSAEKLEAISSVYQISYEELVKALVKDKYGLELTTPRPTEVHMEDGKEKKITITISIGS